jgi:ribosome-associated protein
MREVSISEDDIRLGQFLKLADLVDAGSDAKMLLAGGDVLVNDEVEVRRGRRLTRGDIVTVGDVQLRVG